MAVRRFVADRRWRKTGNLALTAAVAAGSLLVGASPPPTAQAQDAVESSSPVLTVASGVAEHSESLRTASGRQRTQVLTVDLTNPNVRIGVVEAGNRITDPADETVSSMANRTHAVAGVNGDYFEIHASGRPLGGVITDGVVLKSPRGAYNAQLAVRPDGSAVIGPETYTGVVTDGASSTPLASLNVVGDAAAGRITRITSALGATGKLASPATLVTGHLDEDYLMVDAIAPSVTSVPALPASTEGLLAGGAGGKWLQTNVHPGEPLEVAEQISPDNQLNQLLSGATMLVRGGAVYRDPRGTPPRGVNPETAVGLTEDGRHLIMVTFDGRLNKKVAAGVTPAEVGTYLVQHGAYSGLLLDGGGSTEMVARRPGKSWVSVLNTPSDRKERPVANGLFVYTTR
jgi:exopolysaccharide biosynthesis protein